jgi:hypothetical protein
MRQFGQFRWLFRLRLPEAAKMIAADNALLRVQSNFELLCYAAAIR